VRLVALANAIRADLSELTLSGPRARVAAAAAMSVGLAVVVATWLRLDSPLWAATSAFFCTQATQPASFAKAAERIAGTILGAGTVFLALPWLSATPELIPLALLVFSTISIIGGSLSRYGYTWQLGGLTADIICMGVLADPTMGPSITLYRTVETALGAAAAVVVASLVGEPGSTTEKAGAAGWSSLFGANRHVLGHALRTGLAVMLVPVVWNWLELPDLSQMAISVATVMAVPGLAQNPEQIEARIHQRVVLRIAGGLLGGAAGLAVLAASFTSLLPWLMLLMAGIWIGAFMQSTPRETGYVGLQATMAYMLTLVQRAGPPLSLVPGVERMAGVLLGVGLLLLVSAGWPAPRRALSP